MDARHRLIFFESRRWTFVLVERLNYRALGIVRGDLHSAFGSGLRQLLRITWNDFRQEKGSDRRNELTAMILK